MSPLPELNLNLSFTKNKRSSHYEDFEDDAVVTRSDSGLRKHTISLIISDQEVGKINLKIGDKILELPTYKLTITDDKTEETQSYQVTRDTLSFVKSATKKSFLSIFGFKRFDKTNYLYENIPFEPQLEELEKFDISRYRKLTHDVLTYQLMNQNSSIMLFVGDINTFVKPDNINQYFIVVDKDGGKSFIGDVLYREKFLKLTPKVELQIIRRKKIPKNFEFDENGTIKKIVYL